MAFADGLLQIFYRGKSVFSSSDPPRMNSSMGKEKRKKREGGKARKNVKSETAASLVSRYFTSGTAGHE